MSTCWFTSFIGYPNFFKHSGRGAELATFYSTLVDRTQAGETYSKAKKAFPDLDHAQVETKKAAFQEYGLLYVKPRSDVVTVTPLGLQVVKYMKQGVKTLPEQRRLLFCLARALARYQFNNPLPVGGNRGRERAEQTDVLPYLACFYLLANLDGILAISELRGHIFGIQKMSQLRRAVSRIRVRRLSATPFPDLPSLPKNPRTADNLKIYMVSHISMDGELLKHNTRANIYPNPEEVVELTAVGREIVEAVLDSEWSTWRSSRPMPPTAKPYRSIEEYFLNGIGIAVDGGDERRNDETWNQHDERQKAGVLTDDDLEGLKRLPQAEFEEGRKRLRMHARLEHVRNSALVRNAKRLFKKEHGKFFCEACGFVFEHQYGSRVRDFIEAHHRTPIADLKETVRVTSKDLAMVCSNCHRMLHRPKWITIEQLRDTITDRFNH